MSEITERLVRSLRLRAEYRQPGVMAIDDTDVVSKEAADIIEVQEARIAELEKVLERIAFDGVKDRESLIRSAVDYIEGGGMYPNERTIAAFALSKPQTQ